MNLWRYAFLSLLLTLWATDHAAKGVLDQNRAFRPIEITKVTKWTDAENVVGFTLTLLASQLIIATGWIIFGKFEFSRQNSTIMGLQNSHRTKIFFSNIRCVFNFKIALKNFGAKIQFTVVYFTHTDFENMLRFFLRIA